MNVAVVGCGYVGLVTAVGLAARGHDVVGIEADLARREAIAAGRPPFHEPGLEELLRDTLRADAFRVTESLAAAAEAEVVFLAVQTPAGGDGAIELGPLENAAAALADALSGRGDRSRVVAVRSTVVPGTTERVVAPRVSECAAAVAANPEFLSEGSAVRDFLEPDRIVVGCEERLGRDVLGRLYQALGAPVVFTTPATAELAKYASNALLATLISFSNEIARIAEHLPGVDVEEVLGILHQDRRLSPTIDGRKIEPGILAYLKAGCGYGGSCLPKDLSALVAARAREGDEHPLLEAVRTVNDRQPARVVDIAEQALDGLRGRTVGILGLAFKGGSDDVRESPGLRIIDEVLARGGEVVAYDPLVRSDGLDGYAGRIRGAETLAELVGGVDACIVTTNAPEFARLGRLTAAAGTAAPLVIDGRRVVRPDGLGRRYRAVGLGPPADVSDARGSS